LLNRTIGTETHYCGRLKNGNAPVLLLQMDRQRTTARVTKSCLGNKLRRLILRKTKNFCYRPNVDLRTAAREASQFLEYQHEIEIVISLIAGQNRPFPPVLL
jgi:hypothetical protein